MSRKTTSDQSDTQVIEAQIALRKALDEGWRRIDGVQAHWVNVAENFFPAFREYAKALFTREFDKLGGMPQSYVLERIDGITADGETAGPSLKSDVVCRIAPEVWPFLEPPRGHPLDLTSVESEDLIRLIDLCLSNCVHLQPNSTYPLPKKVLDAAMRAGYANDKSLRDNLAALPRTLMGDWANEMGRTMPKGDQDYKSFRLLPLALIHTATRTEFVRQTFHDLRACADELFARRQLRDNEVLRIGDGVTRAFWRQCRRDFTSQNSDGDAELSALWSSSDETYTLTDASSDTRERFKALATIAASGLLLRKEREAWTHWLDVLRTVGRKSRVFAVGQTTIRKDSSDPLTRDAEQSAPQTAIDDGEYLHHSSYGVEISRLYEASADLCLDLEAKTLVNQVGPSGSTDSHDEATRANAIPLDVASTTTPGPEPRKVSGPSPPRNCKGDIALLRKADGTLYESVPFSKAEMYAGITDRRRQQLSKEAGSLVVIGKGPNRRVTVKSLMEYCPPKEDPK